MPEPQNASKRTAAPVADIDEPMWPVNVAIATLAAIVVGIVLTLGDFHDPRPLCNAWTLLAGVGVLVLLTFWGAYRLQLRMRRRLEFGILLSLVLHLSAVVYVYCHPVQLPIIAGRGLAEESNSLDYDELTVPDYHWTEVETPGVEQVFETPVETNLDGNAVPRQATVQPRPADRPVPVAETPRSLRIEAPPFRPTGPGELMALRRQRVAAQKAATIDRMTIDRQAMAAELPKPQTEAISAAASSSNTPRHEIQPQIAAEAQPSGSAKADPARPIARVGANEGVRSAYVAPKLPSNVARSASATTAEPISLAERPRTLARSDRGRGLPSAILVEPDDPVAAPAAAGGSPGSRIKLESSAAVERFSKSRAPRGDAPGADGIQEYGVGSGMTVARSGIPYGKGTARPAISGTSDADPASLRAGALGSFADRGPALPFAAARRGRAAQPQGDGTGRGPDFATTLPRTRTAHGDDLPSAVLPSDNAIDAGAGGVTSVVGGATSHLEVGQVAALQGKPAIDSLGGRVGAVAAPTDIVDASLSSSDLGQTRGGMILAARGTTNRVRSESLGDGIPNGTSREGVARASREPMLSGVVSETAETPTTSGDAVGETGRGLDASIVSNRENDPGNGLSNNGRPAIAVEPAIITRSRETLDRLEDLTSSRPAELPTRQNRDADSAQLLVASVSRDRMILGRSDAGATLGGAALEPTEFYQRRAASRPGLGGQGDGNGFTEPAVEAGLDFFSRIQAPDGHWSLDQAPKGISADEFGPGSMQADTAATGLVLLTYFGAGYTHLDEKHRDVVRRGVRWLIQHQKPDGDLFTGGSRVTHFYSQGIAAMALCEIYGMTQDPDLREPAQKAVQYIIATQDPSGGGWRYEPRQESDTSVTGWQLMAMKSAQMAGLDVPEEPFEKIRGWLVRVQSLERDGRYVYSPSYIDEERNGRRPSLAMTAEGMLMQIYLGQRRDDPQLLLGADYLKTNLPAMGTSDEPLRNCYYWYYATAAMYQMQGPYWEAWNNRLGPLLKTSQVSRGPMAGSWHPTEPVRDAWAHVGGRVYVTAMHLLMLEVYYRYLPLFQELSK